MTDLQRYSLTKEDADAWMELDPQGDYVLFRDLMALIPTEELAGLRAIEEAARDADPTPGQAITSAPAIAALRAALAAKGPRP